MKNPFIAVCYPVGSLSFGFINRIYIYYIRCTMLI